MPGSIHPLEMETSVEFLRGIHSYITLSQHALIFVLDISKLLDYDYAEILKRKDLMHRCLRETGSLLATVEIAYDSALKWLRVH